MPFRFRMATFNQPNLQFEAEEFSGRFWLVIGATGIASGLIGAGLLHLLHVIERAAWPAYRARPDFLAAVSHASPSRRLLVLALAAVLAATVRRLLHRRKVRAHGGDVVEAIWLGSGLIEPIRTFINSALSIVVVGLGAALGREGAIKHAGAAVASQLAVWTRLTPAQRRLAVACGAGAGLAAAYNVPFGGALFAVEVLLGSLALPQVIPALVASLLGTGASWVLLHNQPIYPVTVDRINASEIVWAALAGPVFGLAAAGYIRAIAWADRQTHHGWRAFFAPLGSLLALAVLSLAVPEVLGNGQDAVAGAFAGKFPIGLLAMLPFLRAAATIGCLAGGVPGGLFTPTLACGSLLGGLGGRLLHRMAPSLGETPCAIVGAGAFLAAATEGPVSSLVLILELTRQVQSLLVPLMLAVVGATLVTRRLEARSIYSARIKVKATGAVVRRH
jgi:H+/Cl- antiporter ClcA